MKKLYKAFLKENNGLKCRYSYFTKHRPFYVKPPIVDRRDNCLYYEFIPTTRGCTLLMWRRYTYSEITGKFYCSSRQASKCKARLKLNNDRSKIVLVEGQHFHDPPKYFMTESGNYVKLT